MNPILKHPVFRNWRLKLVSLVLATALWAAVASDPRAEIGVSVPIKYLNVPKQTQVIDDGSNRVELRLLGPASVLGELAPEDVSVSIDMMNVPPGQEKILVLSDEHIQTPFGVQVVRAIPARVRVALEPIITRTVRLAPAFRGELRPGYEVDEERTVITPPAIEVEGPESRVREVETLPTTPIDLSGRRETFTVTADVDITDPFIRIPKAASLQVEVRVRRSSR
jgi:YbbR domain-containing protein